MEAADMHEAVAPWRCVCVLLSLSVCVCVSVSSSTLWMHEELSVARYGIHGSVVDGKHAFRLAITRSACFLEKKSLQGAVDICETDIESSGSSRFCSNLGSALLALWKFRAAREHCSVRSTGRRLVERRPKDLLARLLHTMRL